MPNSKMKITSSIRAYYLSMVNSRFEIHKVDLTELGNDSIRGSTGEINYRDLRPWDCCGGLLSPEEEMEWHVYHIKNCLTYVHEIQDFYAELFNLIKRKGKELNEKKKQAIKRIKAKDEVGTCFKYDKHEIPILFCTNSKQLAKKEQEISEEVEQLSIRTRTDKKKQEEKNERERKEQEKIEKEQTDRSSTFDEIILAFKFDEPYTHPKVCFENLDPTLWNPYENWMEKVWNMPITIPRGKQRSKELENFREEMIKAIKEAEVALKIREENEKRNRENMERENKSLLDQVKVDILEWIKKEMNKKGLTNQDLGEYANYQERINSLNKIYEINGLRDEILNHIFALPKPEPANPSPQPNPNPETPDNPQPEPEKPKENEKVEEIINGFRTHKYDNLTQEELINEIEKEELNGTSLQTLVSQLKIKVQELEEEIRELKAETPQTKEIKDEIHKRETQLQKFKGTLSSIANNNNNNNPWPIIPIISTLGLIALFGLIVYKLRKNRVRR